jgi:hypothetical protein
MQHIPYRLFIGNSHSGTPSDGYERYIIWLFQPTEGSSPFSDPFPSVLRKKGTAAATPFSSAQHWNTILGSISPASQRSYTSATRSLYSKLLFCIDKVFPTNDYCCLMSAWCPQTGRRIIRMDTMQTSGKAGTALFRLCAQ